MRELSECKKEIFDRSEKKIKERRKRRAHIMEFCIPLCVIVIVSAFVFPNIIKNQQTEGILNENAEETDGGLKDEINCAPDGETVPETELSGTQENCPDSDRGENIEEALFIGKYENFSFYIEWGKDGRFSYDGRTEIFEKDGKEKKIFLTEDEKIQIYRMFKELDSFVHLETYVPKSGSDTESYKETLVLTVGNGKYDITKRSENINDEFLNSLSESDFKYFDTCITLENIILKASDRQ